MFKFCNLYFIYIKHFYLFIKEYQYKKKILSVSLAKINGFLKISAKYHLNSD